MDRSTHAPAPRKHAVAPDFFKSGQRPVWGLGKGPVHPAVSLLPPPRKAGRPRQVLRGRS